MIMYYGCSRLVFASVLSWNYLFIYLFPSCSVVIRFRVGHFLLMMDIDQESEWDHLNRTNWRGLGLTDPIKSIEVHSILFALENVI